MIVTKIRTWMFVGLGFLGFYFGLRNTLIENTAEGGWIHNLLTYEHFGWVLVGLFSAFLLLEEFLGRLLKVVTTREPEAPERPETVFDFAVPEDETEHVIEDADTLSHEILGAEYDTAALNPQRSLAVARRCNEAVWRVSEEVTANAKVTKELQGFCLVGYADNQLTDAIARGEVDTGHQIDPGRLVAGPETAASIYVFGLYAKGRFFRKKLTAKAARTLRYQFETHPNLKYCFARGGTKNGDTLLVRFAFKPIDGSRIQVLTRDELIAEVRKREAPIGRVLD